MRARNRKPKRSNTVIKCVMVLSQIGWVFIRQRRLALWNGLGCDFVSFLAGKCFSCLIPFRLGVFQCNKEFSKRACHDRALRRLDVCYRVHVNKCIFVESRRFRKYFTVFFLCLCQRHSRSMSSCEQSALVLQHLPGAGGGALELENMLFAHVLVPRFPR